MVTFSQLSKRRTILSLFVVIAVADGRSGEGARWNMAGMELPFARTTGYYDVEIDDRLEPERKLNR